MKTRLYLPLIFIALLTFGSCKKEDLSVLSGSSWTSVSTDAYGRMTTNIKFTSEGYIMTGDILSPDRTLLLQYCVTTGTYENKGGTIALKATGANFFWAKGGKIDGDIFQIKNISSSKMTFVRTGITF